MLYRSASVRKTARILLGILLLSLILSACVGGPSAPPTAVRKLKVGLVIDSGSSNDRSFNQYTLEGARRAAQEANIDFTYLEPQSANDYEATVENIVLDGADLIITVGFRMGDATAKSAQRHPDRRFLIVDMAYSPGAGCAETVQDCYTQEGGLSNVTSLIFAEDQIGYLAGVLAGCMTHSGTIASIAGIEIPPVVRFVKGYQKGARSARPDINTLNQYIPDFNDPETGRVIAQNFIREGADVIFGVGGNTGNGGLLAAHEAGLMAIGVDVDQYYSYPEIGPSLLSSASKNVDIVAEQAVKAFIEGQLSSGILLSTLENGGIGLAPYHDWDSKIPQSCKDAVETARQAIIADPSLSEAQ